MRRRRAHFKSHLLFYEILCFSLLPDVLCCSFFVAVKLVIRGERKSGKSTLLSRLKGEAFDSNYTPTDEIKANISVISLIPIFCLIEFLS